jgi:hypothetical protein
MSATSGAIALDAFMAPGTGFPVEPYGAKLPATAATATGTQLPW